MARPAAPATGGAAAPVDPRLLARGLAALRIFVGAIFFANGLAKLFGFHAVRLGPYAANLIDRDDARFILDYEVNRNPAHGGPGTELPLLGNVVNDVVLPNFGFFGWLVTAVELGVGALLLVGLASRAAALVGLGQQLFLAAVYFSSDRWLFEQPHEYVPLVILALVPAGRTWGLDARTVRTRRARWPF